MVNEHELNEYRINVIESFLKNILEIDKEEAIQNALLLNKNLSKNALVKLVHFFDMINQTTDGKFPSCNGCNGECGRCSNR